MPNTEQLLYQTDKSRHRRCSQNFSKLFLIFTEKHLCWSLFFMKLQTSDLQLYKKENPTQVFSCCEIFAKHLFWRTYVDGCFWTEFTKWLFGTLFPCSCFQNHPDLVILQKYRSLSNQSFKHNSAHSHVYN